MKKIVVLFLLGMIMLTCWTSEGRAETGKNKTGKNDPSKSAALNKQREEDAADAVLNKYRDIADQIHSKGMDDLDPIVRNGVIPPFGRESKDYDGKPYYYASECHYIETCGDNWEHTGITRRDITGDGTKELLIGYYDEGADKADKPTSLFAAYSVKGGKIQTIFQGWSRSVYYLSKDGSIIHTGSGGAFTYTITNYKLVEDKEGLLVLQETETVAADGLANPEKPFTYYPEGRKLTGYDEYDEPEYSSENALQMDEKTGNGQYQKLFSKAVPVKLQPFPGKR